MTEPSHWDATSPDAWGAALGLVPVPLFGAGAVGVPPGSHAVLLDGSRASFAMSSATTLDLSLEPLSWSWSSNLRHTIAVDTRRARMTVRHWDDPASPVDLPVPSSKQEAQTLLERLEKLAPPAAVDVIEHVLRVFRRLRQRLPNDAVEAIRVLNALLVGAEKVREGQITEREWSKCARVRDILGLLDANERDATGADGLGGRVLNIAIADAGEELLQTMPHTGCRLAPGLLLRHAASHLYQEAHIEIEQPTQPHLPGFEHEGAPPGVPARKDVRFTPPTLARTLAQHALDGLQTTHRLPETLQILDPACGSGVFLQEVLRELCRRHYRGTVRLVGLDTSPISRLIAHFCLTRAARDAAPAGVTVEVTIQEQDALQADWPSADIVLMNPPFVGWNAMSATERETTRAILGEVFSGKPDMALAFLWKAKETLRRGGVLATVLPVAQLETESSQTLRRSLLESMVPSLVGRFEDGRYFRSARVLASFVVLRSVAAAEEPGADVCLVRAAEGEEDAALRALRRDSGGAASPDRGWEVYRSPLAQLSEQGWIPRRQTESALHRYAIELKIPRVKDLFDVRQGARTGSNPVFVLSDNSVRALPRPERKFFRPIADSATIHDGCLRRSEWLFYPYDANGLMMTEERDLDANVRSYHTEHLKPARKALSARARTKGQWWKLAEPRAWQYVRSPSLVSKYFGARGSFACNHDGRFVVVQGMAWLWKRDNRAFHRNSYAWAYLALLNSGAFAGLLKLCCPRVEGGQYNLSTRFVGEAFLPDLTDRTQVDKQTVEDLAELGRSIHESGLSAVSKEELSRAALMAYGDLGAVLYASSQLGDHPWMEITQKLLRRLRPDDISELTLPVMVEFATEEGYDWHEVQLVVEKLSRGSFAPLERYFVRGRGARAQAVHEDDVQRMLQDYDSSTESKTRFEHWAGGIRVLWRRSKR